MNILLGTIPHSMDVKYRVRIPSKFKNELTEGGQKLHFVQLSDDCIAVMNDTGLKARFGAFEDVDFTDEDALEALREFSEKVEDIEEDSQGRITLSRTVREHIGADKEHTELVAIGMIGYIEIWSADRRKARREERSNSNADLQAKLKKAKKSAAEESIR